MGIGKILVPVDFTPASDAALAYALAMADAHGAEVELLHVWQPSSLRESVAHIFAESPEGVAMERRLSAAETTGRLARVCGRLEFGGEPSEVILAILEREPFDLVVMGHDEQVSSRVTRTARCKVVTLRAA